MRRSPSRKPFAFAAVLLVAAPALAHIELVFPPPRYPNDGRDGQNKNCPCGVGGGGQLCTAGITSDDNRSGNVTAIRTGATLTVQFEETVGHSGRFRVAFDGDGADLADFNATVLGDVPDPRDGEGKRTMTVTLPTTACTNCTLQLIQDMNGNTVDPVADPTGDDSYFQCADIVLADDAPDPPVAVAAAGCAAAGASTSGSAVALGALLFAARRRCR